MKDEGGRLRGYGYADFEDRDSLVSWKIFINCWFLRCTIFLNLIKMSLLWKLNVIQIDVLSMTDLAVNNRKMRIDLASQVIRCKLSDFDVISWTSMPCISCSRFHALFPTRLVKAPEGLEAVLATGKVEAEERRILMLAGPLSKHSKYCIHKYFFHSPV